jgi:hypothetical protein
MIDNSISMRKTILVIFLITLVVVPVGALEYTYLTIHSQGNITYNQGPTNVLFYTSFEDYTVANEPYDDEVGIQGKYARGGNWRVNMPNNPLHPYDLAGVHSGSKSIHVWGEKAWQWGYDVNPRLPYGETDLVTGQWLLPGQGRPLTNVQDVPYNYLWGTPNAAISSVLPSEYGRYHWEMMEGQARTLGTI